jgi:hypothetical protein
MKKLDDIPKKNVFEVPEGYFDRLPGIIQSRVTTENAAPSWISSWGWSLRYAVPALVLIVAGLFWLPIRGTKSPNIANELALIEPQQLGLYLEEHGLSTEDLMETTTWDAGDLQDLENAVYSQYPIEDKEIKKIEDEYNVEL